MSIKGRHLLILEDEPIVGLALEDMIADAGGRSIYAEYLEQAIELIAVEPLDGAILDVNVHGEKSYTVAHMLTQVGVPFIFATGYGDSLHPAEFKKVPTVTKPYGLSDIEKALGFVFASQVR